MSPSDARKALNDATARYNEYTREHAGRVLQLEANVGTAERALQAAKTALRTALRGDDQAAIEDAERSIKAAETELQRAKVRHEMAGTWMQEDDVRAQLQAFSSAVSDAWAVLWQAHVDEHTRLEQAARAARETYLEVFKAMCASYRECAQLSHERQFTPLVTPRRARQIDWEIEWDTLLKSSGGIHSMYY